MNGARRTRAGHPPKIALAPMRGTRGQGTAAFSFKDEDHG
jgi:hypothetical protein